MRLYRITGDEKYLKQAKFFIDMRGRKDKRSEVYGEYCQDHEPLVEQTKAVGHAVRGGYLYAGVADVAALTGDEDYLRAIDQIWQDVMDCKLYIIGSVGQHGAGEGYAGAWKLDNVRAYNETCAAIALALWNHRMFMLHGEAKYIDVLERILYNGFLSGVSLSGDQFFYPNPLACDMQFKFNHGSLERSPWFGCSCCPVNVVRFLPSIPGMGYATRDETLYVNLFLNGRAEIELGEQVVRVQQTTDYPWDGKIKIKVEPGAARDFEMKIRIPGWSQGRPVPSDLYEYVGKAASLPEVSLNGKTVPLEIGSDGFSSVRRRWEQGDELQLDLPMPIRRVESHPNVEPNRGRIAIERGPVVYCMEGADHDGKIMNLFLPDDGPLNVERRDDLLGGVTVLTGKAKAVDRDSDGKVVEQAVDLTMIPYYAWCHRGPNEMQVWIPRNVEGAKLPPIPTIASSAKVTASFCYPNDSLAALNDQQVPKSSDDHSIGRLTWWNHKGTKEWVQYDLEEPKQVSNVEVYWFDDTGRGGCRVPASWQVLCRHDGQWKPVRGTVPAHVQKDAFNVVEFDPVTTDSVRLEVKLQDGFSGGILEWRIK